MKSYDIFSPKSIVITLLVLGVVTHALWFGHPNSAVFDEVHFGKFISAYFTHEYYFDIHPPLGKLVLAGWGWLWGFKPGFSFANIGEVYPDNLYMLLRLLPMLAGALLPLVIFGVARQLKLSLPAAALAGILVALDNALLVQSRLILLDPFLLLFGFTALYCYLRWRDGGTKWLLLATGVLGGMAMGIKWTGLTFLALVGILELIHLWQDRRGTARRRLGPLVATLVVAPLLVYASAFAVHFALLSKTGTGDAFMSTRFQSTLNGSRFSGDTGLAPEGTLQKTVELNTEMYRSNQRLTATHPYSSKWYTWPLMARPIFYWVQDTARIYLLGNPVVWWGSTVAVLWLFLNLFFTGFRTASRTPLILAGAWLMNIVPFVGITRVMFLYHYFTALIWAILMLAYCIDQTRHVKKTVIGISCAALALFIFFAPLSYGLPLSERAYNARVWFSSWR
jgi:dolichyl-phosphate-mannose-protein mannosyltransferase